MATTLEHISHYKGEDILIWNNRGARSFSYGNREYANISEARSAVDSIGQNINPEADEISVEDLEAAADYVDRLMAGDSNYGR